MANALYPKWKEALLSGAPNCALTDVGASGFFAVLLNELYTYSAAHQFYSSIPIDAFASSDLEIAAVTTTNGIVNGDDVTFLSVQPGPVIRSIMLFRKNPGASSSWRLVSFMDTNVSGLPAVPNGNDIIINWYPTGIFGL